MYPKLILAMVLVLFVGCTGVIYPNDGGDDGGVVQKNFLIDSISFSGTTSEDCSVSIGDTPDEDGVDDKAYQGGFFLDDGAGPGSWPTDDGSRQQHSFLIKATRKSDGQVLYKKVTVTLYEGSSESY